MSSPPIRSIELWTSAKVIGRECAQVNKDYLLCKKEAGRGDMNHANPEACMDKANLSSSCAHKMYVYY